MKSLLLLTAAFALTLAGIWYLDREDRLPAVYTGPSTAKADEPPPEHWYTLARPFSVNLRGDRHVRLTVALELPQKLPKFVREGDAAGQLREEAVIREIVTETVMARSATTMRTAAGRRTVEDLLRRRIRAHTDVRAQRVLLPDVIVQ